MESFEEAFFEANLKPYNINENPPVENNLNQVWSNLEKDEHKTVRILRVIKEEDEDVLNIFVEGQLERINQLVYKGMVDGHSITIEDSGDVLSIKCPHNIEREKNYWSFRKLTLVGLEKRSQAVVEILEDRLHISQEIAAGMESVPFTVLLHYVSS